MSDFYFSTEAYNIINQFHNVDAIVYVEGDDDILFWYNYFNFANFPVKIEQVGGKENLPTYINKIIEENAKIIVAIDSDYTTLLKTKYSHPLIIYTAGYSIENTMYCPYSINSLIVSYTHRPKNYLDTIKTWLNEYLSVVEELVVYDLANEVYQKSTTVLGDACNIFLEDNSSSKLDLDKINIYINEKLSHFTSKELDYARNLLSDPQLNLFKHVKGHFLTSAIINLVREQVFLEKSKKVTINTESLYANTINNCTRNNCNCEQKEKYIDDICNAAQYMGITI